MLIKGLRKGLFKGLAFTAGTAIGTFSVLRMDDMIYTQLKRHVVIPVQVLTNQQNITVDDLREVGQGAGTFAS
jgi:hypothetical protein